MAMEWCYVLLKIWYRFVDPCYYLHLFSLVSFYLEVLSFYLVSLYLWTMSYNDKGNCRLTYRQVIIVDYCATFEEILLLRNSTCLYNFFLNYIHLKSVDFEWFWYLYEICWSHIMLDWVSRAHVYGYEEECGAPLISRDHNLTPSVLKYWGPYIVHFRKDMEGWFWYLSGLLRKCSTVFKDMKMIYAMVFSVDWWCLKCWFCFEFEFEL